MMLQTFLERAIAAAIRGINTAKHLVHSGLQFADSALPASHIHRKWVIVGCFSLPVLGAVVAIASSGENSPATFQAGDPAAVVQAIDLNLAQVGVYAVDPLVAEEKIRRGETLVEMLERLNVNTTGLSTFIKSDPVAKKLSNLRAGRVLSVQQNAAGDLVWLRYKSGVDEDSQESILVQKVNGQFSAKLESVNFEKQVVFKSGRIESSLFAAADKAGLPDSVAIQFTEIFGSDIDFHRELQRGDEFRVVYEDLLIDGRSARAGRVLSVEFINAGKEHKAYWFAPKGQQAGYYNEEGRSLKKSFLRAPLAFSRISSGFTTARFHPILQTWKAHKGVDYAAATGTPVMATASGIVKYAGQQNGYGNFIEIQHPGGISTAYAHLSGFARGLRKGQSVEQGQIIGFVGSTGWATGPHLHYEFRVNSVARDPLSVKVAQAIPLDRAALTEFKRVQLGMDRRMALAAQVRVANAQ
ncbi:peptidoglycan DD-metalloendopeptidase family protein [Limnobacter humi]|uniref:Peptidoglycan DD-metalloendopeptidase family protein n=1 Tax=Limnobacter humi TaxID=1778671 RepID=A0ABT1WH54_9BURK|nr:peptidoglycan DD-metalloendopeptidase family protein [Limnobacter humi]MCQ8896853.1 peptidoglycan DD-metalloendopeptidase family protein [Limnobacter humi]